MSKYHKTAISLVNPRETALYFDHVIPVNLGNVLLKLGDPNDEIRNSMVFPPEIGSELMPPELMSRNGFIDRFIAVNTATWYLILKTMAAQHNLPPKIGGLSQDEFDSIETRAEKAFFSFVNDFGLTACTVDAPEISLTDDSPPTEDIAVTLANLNLIDVEKTSWAHILEFRRSRDAREKLRRLRLFAFQNYGGCDRAFVEDDILRKLDDYSQTIAEWGFETRRGALTTLLSSKLLAGSLTGSVISSLMGQPLPAAISAIGGLTIEIGSIALSIQKRAFELRKLVRDSPIVYIHDAQKALHKEV